MFTWGDTPRESYVNTISIIDELTTFVEKHQQKKGRGIFGGQHHVPLADKKNVAVEILPFLRGRVSSQRRLIGNYSDLSEVLEFVNSHDAERLASLERVARTTLSAPRSAPCMSLESVQRHSRIEECD